MYIQSGEKEEDKIEDYIKRVYTDEDTVDVVLLPDSNWYYNSMDEECKEYMVTRRMKRHYDGKIIVCSPEYVRVVLEDDKADMHHVVVESIL